MIAGSSLTLELRGDQPCHHERLLLQPKLTHFYVSFFHARGWSYHLGPWVSPYGPSWPLVDYSRLAPETKLAGMKAGKFLCEVLGIVFRDGVIG